MKLHQSSVQVELSIADARTLRALAGGLSGIEDPHHLSVRCVDADERDRLMQFAREMYHILLHV